MKFGAKILFLILISVSVTSETHAFTKKILGLFGLAQHAEESAIKPPFWTISEEDHQVVLLNEGIAALEKRLEMVERAEESIAVEYFILGGDQDRSTRIFSQALIAKAKQGVKIRMLIDKSPGVAKFDRYMATAMMKHGIEIKYYNPAPAIQIFKANYRNHRKLLVVDGREMITGGRNLSDEYFDLSYEYNFLDRDLWISGPIVEQALETFNRYFNHKLSKTVKKRIPPTLNNYFDYVTPSGGSGDNNDPHEDLKKAKEKYRKGTERAQQFAHPQPRDLDLREKIRHLGGQYLQSSLSTVCSKMAFASDMPGYGGDTRVIKPLFQKYMRTAEDRLIIEAPYLITKSSVRRVLLDLLKKDVKVSLLTNSPYSTDVLYTTTAFNGNIIPVLEKGATAFLFKGSPMEGYETIDPEAMETKWGTHAKTAVIDGHVSIVGTYNLDPRSRNINSEDVAVCIGNHELGAAIEDDIIERLLLSRKLGKDGLPVDGSGVLQGTGIATRILYPILYPISNIFDFLL